MKKLLIIIASLVFFLAALTIYLNRVVFPQVIKNVAVQRLEEVLKRRVEIGSIHFNWFRGFIIDKIKIHEKSSPQDIFVQADQVSFGVLVFPGLKHFRISIPYINVRSPSVHLVRTGVDTWNFSDMLPASTTPAAMPPPGGAKAVRGPAFEIAWGGVSISNGKCLVDDISTPSKWSEYFDNINLKLSLSYKGINYDFTAAIPQRGGMVGATVYYQPITKEVEAQIHLKNIDMASYLSLVDIPSFHLDSGLLKTIDLKIKHTQTMTSAQGDILMDHLDITGHKQHFKGDIEVRGLEAQYQNGAVSARGQLALNNIRTSVPGLTVGGSV
ncbi:MAG: DUF748 domain-containing protein, partial [Candidatus Omnitrophica bacterium]|nr:DUF748 domain-containing protein [Candidatus Omnitrophota bacterium]